jgi:hypothetical protein
MLPAVDTTAGSIVFYSACLDLRLKVEVELEHLLGVHA